MPASFFLVIRKIMLKNPHISVFKQGLRGLSVFLTVIGIDERKITASLENYDFADIEDCLQTECEKDFSADYIVTRNIKNFQNSMILPILPDEFLKMVNYTHCLRDLPC